MSGEPSADTWYEIIVTATDSHGLYTTKSLNIYPRKSKLTLATDPAGLGLELDGIPVATPFSTEGVVGFQRELAAPPTAVAADGTVYHFTGWSDGGGIRHVITTPDTDTTWTAKYAPSAPFNGEYFDNTNLSGTPVLTRQDPQINFVWQYGSPDPAVPADNFSVRWSKTEYFAEGRYKFTTATDDGVRLYIDNRLVIDHWQSQSGTAYDYVTDLGNGNHTIEMEYFEGSGSATATLSWDTTPDQPDQPFLAEYWNTPGTGSAPTIPARAPDVSRHESTINYDWGTGSPDPAIAPDHFAARWTRKMSLAPGIYDFTVTADDGVRLTVDGVRVIDKWVDESPTSYTASVVIDGGPHSVVMEYYENFGGAVARLTYTQTGDLPAPQPYAAEYWNTPNGGGSPTIPTTPPDLSRKDASINFDWGAGSPDPAIAPDHFVARWTRTDVLSSGVYRFSGTSDDGIRVFVDGVQVLNQWQDQNAPFSADTVILSGTHTIQVDYFEDSGGAAISFNYTRIGDVVSPGGYSAEYFANKDLSGTPAVTRTDQDVNFDWGNGSPDPAIPVDDFSARWTRSVSLAAGTYTFTVVGDDGVRLYVDGELVIDGWVDQAPSTYSATKALGDGTHLIVLEYYEHTGGAVARLSFTQTG
jgi:hypothetical protein